MGAADEFTQRASSPMKRRASDLEQDNTPDVQNVTESRLTSSFSSSAHAATEPQESPSDTMDHDAGLAGSRGTCAVAKAIPTIDEQIREVTELCTAFATSTLRAGSKAYLVSNSWLARVKARAPGAKGRTEDIEGDIGPIDNGDLIAEVIIRKDKTKFARLRPDISDDAYTVFPEEAWHYVSELYGVKAGSMAIVRIAHNTSQDFDNVQFELHPPIIKVHRLWSAISPIPLPQLLKAQQPPAPILVMSRNDLYVDLLREVKRSASVDITSKIRLWRLPKILPTGQTTGEIAEPSPPPSRPATPLQELAASTSALLMAKEDFMKLERGLQRELVDIDDYSANPNYNGKSFTIGMASMGDEELVIDEHIEKTSFVSNYVASNIESVAVNNIRGSAVQNKSLNNSGRSSPALSGPITRARLQRSGRTLGTVGLSNLGNTCYMNSALQCVRSVEELTKYFLTDSENDELNYENPLGNNGEVAIQYGKLLKDMYRGTGASSVTPRNFKQTIGRYAPSFSGYGQQDSQEFLGFLLDGLQEDLSRIKRKPYIEKPDSTDEMVGNPVAIREMADKVWDITKKRDDSVIADLFTGMYKSTLVCPDCAKVSITFDPFNNLTLQLPIENKWSHTLLFVPISGMPVRIQVELDKQAPIKVLKEFVSKRVNVPVERLFVAELWKSKFYKLFDDMKCASEDISGNDEVAIYELESVPTNYPLVNNRQKKKNAGFSMHISDDVEIPVWSDAAADRLLVSVFHRKPVTDRSRYGRKENEFALIPHFIILTPDEARSEDVIRRKILEKIAGFTTHPELHKDDEDDDESEENLDPELVVTTASDADSSGDGKVMAVSVDGEDDVVDILMRDGSDVKSSNGSSGPSAESSRLPITKRPRWADANQPLPANFERLFWLRYFSAPQEVIPIAYSTLEEDKDYPLLSSREPVFDNVSESDERDGRAGPLSDSGLSEEDDDSSTRAQTRMNNDSSEDELASMNNAHKVGPPESPYFHENRSWDNFDDSQNIIAMRPKKVKKTYSKRFAVHAFRQRDTEASESDETTEDDGPLVRIGEGIIVDWDPASFETLFEGHIDDEMRGQATYVRAPILEDSELDQKRLARERRKKKGISLDECLDEFEREEILSEHDTWYCPRCKEHRRASKKFELWKTPDILVMHLKRFSSSGTRRDKLEVEVDFPIEALDLTSRVMATEEGKDEVYDLFAVDDHWGGLGGGHYTAFAKSFIDGEWYEYNDSSATKQKDTSGIVSSGAYLLFYRRRSDVPLGGPRFKDIVETYDRSLEAPEDDDSGEGPRLGGGFSLRGSSSALTGVGAARQSPGSVGVPKNSIVNPGAIDNLPDYSEHLQDGDSASLQLEDAVVNDGIELDEAVCFNERPSTLQGLGSAGWSWGGLGSAPAGPSVAGSEVAYNAGSDRSDAVQNASTASADSIRNRVLDFDNTPEDYGDNFEPPMEVPDMDEDAAMNTYSLRQDLVDDATRRFSGGAQHQEHVVREVGSGGDEDEDAPATEIHVEEGEGV